MKKRVSNTKGGTFVQKNVTIGELLKMQINLPDRPGQPWSNQECRERWEKSESTGHRQLWCKCQNCGLEFIILTLRTPLELIEAYEPSHGRDAGMVTKVSCPECGQTGKAALLGVRHQGGAIFRYTAGRFRLPIIIGNSDILTDIGPRG